MAMRLQTPEKIRTLQRKLYLKAKAEPDFRFYLLYDKVYREDILFHAYRLARSNKGAPGVDGQSFEEIEAMGLEGWLSGIRDDLRAKTYRPEPVRRAMVPKPGGGERPLGIPTIRDRVVQGAVKLVIEPIFEADLEPSAYGYRPKRSAGDAVQAVHKLLCRGYTDVVDADLSKYFDTIPHAELMQSVFSEIRLLASTDFDSRAILSVVFAGDNRLLERLRHPDLQPIASRNRLRRPIHPDDGQWKTIRS